MNYQQITFTFESDDDDGETHVQTVLVDDAAGDLSNVLTQLTTFLRAAGYSYVTRLEAHTEVAGFSQLGNAF